MYIIFLNESNTIKYLKYKKADIIKLTQKVEEAKQFSNYKSALNNAEMLKKEYKDNVIQIGEIPEEQDLSKDKVVKELKKHLQDCQLLTVDSDSNIVMHIVNDSNDFKVTIIRDIKGRIKDSTLVITGKVRAKNAFVNDTFFDLETALGFIEDNT